MKTVVEKALKIYQQLGSLAEHYISPEAQWRAAIGQAQALLGLQKFELAFMAYEQAEKLLQDATMNIGCGQGRSNFVSQKQRSAQKYLSLLLPCGI